MMGGGATNPGDMQNMMQNPSIQGMMQNPEFLENTAKMLKDPRNKAMLDMMKQQNPNMNIDLLLKGMSGLAKVASCYKTMKRAWSIVWVRLTLFGLFMVLVAYIFG